MPSENHVRLARFARAVEDSLGWEFDYEEFDDRLRMQKFVLLAREFGFNHPYSYGIHLHGPYSPSLAEDYYDEEFHAVRDEVNPLEGFESDAFADLVEDKDRLWLEVASTIKSLHDRYSRPFNDDVRNDVLSRTVELKDVDRDTAGEIYYELESAGVL